jgi:hypothetical protein
MSPQGKPLTHERVMQLKDEPGLVILCGRYEAVDQRLLDRCVDEEISLGDFVLSGGELPAMALDGCRDPPDCPAYWATMPRRSKTVSSTACSIRRTTRGRKRMKAWRAAGADGRQPCRDRKVAPPAHAGSDREEAARSAGQGARAPAS